MAVRVDPDLLPEIKKFGAVGVEKCFNCGNCTAICPLSKSDSSFPRRLIRQVQLGMKDELLGSKELWLCYNCGECSETCPKQAEPGNLMAAARCYAITNYSPLKISTMFCKYPVVGALVVTLMGLFFSIFMYGESGVMTTGQLKLFGFIPYELIHNVGLGAMILIGIISLATVKNFFTGAHEHWLKAFWDAVVVQSLAQKRFREECETPENRKTWYVSKWFVHAATMWGFLGLLSATALNYLLDIVGLKATGVFVPLWYPTRLIGTLSGLLFMYGVSVLLYKRVNSVDKAHSFSRFSDYTFLTLLWLSGVTGFIIEIALYLPGAPMWGYWVFIFHVAVSITLLLLLPFTKFAHAIYRIVALYIHALHPVPTQEREPAPAGTD